MAKDWVGMQHLPRLLGIVAVLGIFGVGNVALYFGQELFYREDTKKLEALQLRLPGLKAEIDALELKLKELEPKVTESETKITKCKTEIAAIEATSSNGTLPDAVFDKYERSLSKCNARVGTHNELVAAYNPAYDAYSAKIGEYNVLVDQANALAKKTGTRYYIVPVPKAGGRRR